MQEIWRLEKEQKVCSIDVDGILVNYPFCWIEFINKKSDNNFSNLSEAKKGLSYSEYRILKIQYRESGAKATLPVIKGASKFVKILQENGFKVILMTARPYRKHRRIWKDTMEWLKTNNINPDGMIWQKEKHWSVLQEFPYMSFMVEDNAEIANQVARIGYKVYVLDNEYNKQKLEKNCSRVFSLEEILKSEVI